MIRKNWQYVLFPILLATLTTCELPPDYSVIPEIEMNNFVFKPKLDAQGNYNFSDSVYVTINFKDGDGDLGLRGDEELAYNFYVYENKDTVRYGDNDTLPSFNCENYEILTTSKIINGILRQVNDTFLVHRNPNHYNFYMDVLVKKGNTYQVFDWNTISYDGNCVAPMHGRFPYLKDENEPANDKPLEGEIRYAREGPFRLIFRYDTIKLRLYLKDRQYHQSNVVETKAFNIEEFFN